MEKIYLNGKRSGLSNFAEKMLWLVLISKRNVSEKRTEKDINRTGRRNEHHKVPKGFNKIFNFNIEMHNGFEVCCWGDKNTERTVFYIHGGAYMYQPLVFHYMYCKRLARELNAYVIMPVYPKAPKYHCKEQLEWIAETYSSVLKTRKPENIIFMGDSAGASLVVTLSQYCADNGIPLPSRIFSFSPCIDLAFDNPDIANYKKLDPMLDAPDLRRKVKMFLSDTDAHSPLASPMSCDFSVLPHVTFFIGTHEILHADAVKFKKVLEEKNIDFNFYEYANMNHTFSIFPIPESKECMEIIKEELCPPKADN